MEIGSHASSLKIPIRVNSFSSADGTEGDLLDRNVVTITLYNLQSLAFV